MLYEMNNSNCKVIYIYQLSYSYSPMLYVQSLRVFIRRVFRIFIFQFFFFIRICKFYLVLKNDQLTYMYLILETAVLFGSFSA